MKVYEREGVGKVRRDSTSTTSLKQTDWGVFEWFD